MTAVTARGVWFRELPKPRQRLIRMMQVINFGRVSFRVRGGEADLDRTCRTRQTLKLPAGLSETRPETGLVDFELCRQQVALLETLGRIQDGVRVTVEVRHGVPLLVEIEQNHPGI